MLSERQKVKHLFSRAAFGESVISGLPGFNLSFENLFKEHSYKPLQSVTLEEVTKAKEMMKSGNMAEAKDLKQQMKQNVFELNNLWLDEMIKSESQLSEKMALFWHGHFACRSANPYFDQQYLDVIRRNTLGNFGTMLSEVAKTPAMLQFLNNQQNKKSHPNENFARELMELFTLGRGNYSESDIRESARAFTGYGFDATGQFKFKTQQHDFGTKTFFGKSGNFTGDDILKIILEKKECAKFIVHKLYTFFVNDQPDPQVITQLADQFYNSGYEIKPLMRSLFSSEWFYDEKNIGVKIKSPVELFAGMMRTVPLTFSQVQSTLFIQRSLGQVLLNPPNVAGWPGGRSWIDSSSLLFRMRLPQVLYYDKDIDFSPKDETPEMGMKATMADTFVKSLAAKKLNAVPDWKGAISSFSNSNSIDEVAEKLLVKIPDAAILKSVGSRADRSTKENEIKSMVIGIMSLPEYQLS